MTIFFYIVHNHYSIIEVNIHCDDPFEAVILVIYNKSEYKNVPHNTEFYVEIKQSCHVEGTADVRTGAWLSGCRKKYLFIASWMCLEVSWIFLHDPFILYQTFSNLYSFIFLRIWNVKNSGYTQITTVFINPQNAFCHNAKFLKTLKYGHFHHRWHRKKELENLNTHSCGYWILNSLSHHVNNIFVMLFKG